MFNREFRVKCIFNSEIEWNQKSTQNLISSLDDASYQEKSPNQGCFRKSKVCNADNFFHKLIDLHERKRIDFTKITKFNI